MFNSSLKEANDPEMTHRRGKKISTIFAVIKRQNNLQSINPEGLQQF